MKQAALYLRVSTDDQTNENQEVRLTDICKSRSWEIFQVYKDVESGAKRSRPGLDRMIMDARSGAFQVVMAVKVDRIARSVRDLLEIASSLTLNGVDLTFSDQDFDIGTSEGRLMFKILGSFAEYEREIISERTKAGLRRVKREGRKLGRPKIHGGTVQAIKRSFQDEDLSMGEISKKYGISKASVSRILKGVPKRAHVKVGLSVAELKGVSETTDLETKGGE